MEPGVVLDIPAGGAIQSRALSDLGYRVVSVDLFPAASREQTSTWICADANEVLPFRDAAFDYVLSREGIEHLEDQMGFLRNCARVIRPGGKLVLTTPNLMHLSARASAFLTGQRNLRRGLVNEIQTPRTRNPVGGRVYHGHVFMLDYYRARYMMRLAGFDHLEVFTDRWSPTSLAMSPLVPVLWLAMKFSAAASSRNARRPGHRPPRDEVTREIIGHVLSSALLYGKRMVIVAERVAA
jgi:SAM-dependent methyltransferase